MSHYIMSYKYGQRARKFLRHLYFFILVFNETVIPFALLECEMIIANVACSVQLATNSHSTRTRGIILKYFLKHDLRISVNLYIVYFYDFSHSFPVPGYCWFYISPAMFPRSRTPYLDSARRPVVVCHQDTSRSLDTSLWRQNLPHTWLSSRKHWTVEHAE